MSAHHDKVLTNKDKGQFGGGLNMKISHHCQNKKLFFYLIKL